MEESALPDELVVGAALYTMVPSASAPPASGDAGTGRLTSSPDRGESSRWNSAHRKRRRSRSGHVRHLAASGLPEPDTHQSRRQLRLLVEQVGRRFGTVTKRSIRWS